MGTVALPSPDWSADLELARAIVAGSIDHWHRLVQEYSGLIEVVIKRHVHNLDEDDLRNLYVDVLRSLYGGRLASFEGRCSLGSWLVQITRSHAMDFLRRRHGRRQRPRGVGSLGSRDRQVFNLYYMQGLSVPDIVQRFESIAPPITVTEVWGSVVRIEEKLQRRSARRLAADLQARSVGVAAGRLLEFWAHARQDIERRMLDGHADAEILRAENDALEAKLRRLIQRLPETDRHVIDLRFYRQLSANAIAAELGLDHRRAAYTLVERAVRRLRRLFDAESADA